MEPDTQTDRLLQIVLKNKSESVTITEIHYVALKHIKQQWLIALEKTKQL